MKALVSRLASMGDKRRSRRFKWLTLLGGIVFFLVAIPWLLLLIGTWLSGFFPQADFPDAVEGSVVLISILLGMSILGWSVLTLWKSGRGTPAPLAPTETIVTSGPYRYCRNPIQLGGSFYFLGVVTFFSSLVAGILAFILTLLGATVYHKLVEEKELLLRFRDDYREYMERTPFLLPGWGFWKRKKEK